MFKAVVVPVVKDVAAFAEFLLSIVCVVCCSGVVLVLLMVLYCFCIDGVVLLLH